MSIGRDRTLCYVINSNSTSPGTASSFVHVENNEIAVEPPKDFDFYRSLEAIVTNGTNDFLFRLLEHARSVEDLERMEQALDELEKRIEELERWR